MTAKEYLSGYETLQLKIRQLEAELCELKRYDGYGKQHKRRRNAEFTKVVEQRVFIEGEVHKAIAECNERRHRIIAQIHTLDNPVYIEVLYRRYVDLQKDFKRMSVEMNYNYDHMRHIHGHALQAFYNLFKEEIE